MSLAKLRPVLYAGRCCVKLHALDRGRAGRDAVVLLAHYTSAELDVSIRPAGIGSVPISARVSLLATEHYFVRGEDAATLETPDVEGLYVAMFTKCHQVLEVSIRRQGCRDVVRVSLEGLPEFFRWCRRARQISFDGGKMSGLDAEELAVLCGIRPRPIGVQLNAFDGIDLAGVDVLDGDAEADTLQQGVQ
jgi:hypothetical protein